MDEATSSVDFDTDALIQQTIRTEFGGGQCTVLTVAHRLDSIADSDRILVMDAGVVAEYDTPAALMKNPSSLYSRLLKAERQGNSRVQKVQSQESPKAVLISTIKAVPAASPATNPVVESPLKSTREANEASAQDAIVADEEIVVVADDRDDAVLNVSTTGETSDEILVP